MPSKKSTQNVLPTSQAAQQGGGGVRPPSPVVLAEGMDPVVFLLGVIDKKTRNLEKRKQRLTVLEESLVSGKELDKDQKEAVTKLHDVSVQLELARDFQKQFQNVHAEHQKLLKKKQKQEKLQQKESEQEVAKSTLRYVLRIQYLLVSMDDISREHFRGGLEGAERLSEAELMQLDEFYQLVNPERPDDPRYSEKVDEASEHLLLLCEKSTKPVVNTTYAALHDVLQKIDKCGYFDKASEVEEEADDDDEDSDNVPEGEFVEPEVEMVHSPEVTEYERYDEAAVVPPMSEMEVTNDLVSSGPSQAVQVPPDPSPTVRLTPVQQRFVEPLPSESVESFSSSVPSPDFAGLQATGDLGCVDGFSFMRDSTVQHDVPPEQNTVTAQPQRYTCVYPAHTSLHLLPVTTSPSSQPTTIDPPPLDEVTVNGQTQSAPTNQSYTHDRQVSGGYHGKSSHRGYVESRGGHGGQRSSSGYNNNRRNQPGGGTGGGREGSGRPRYNGHKSVPQRGRPNYRQQQPTRNK